MRFTGLISLSSIPQNCNIYMKLPPLILLLTETREQWAFLRILLIFDAIHSLPPQLLAFMRKRFYILKTLFKISMLIQFFYIRACATSPYVLIVFHLYFFFYANFFLLSVTHRTEYNAHRYRSSFEIFWVLDAKICRPYNSLKGYFCTIIYVYPIPDTCVRVLFTKSKL